MPFHKLFLVFFLSRISAEERRSGYEDVNFGRGHGNFMIGRSFVDTVSGFKITCNSLDQPEYPLSTGVFCPEGAQKPCKHHSYVQSFLVFGLFAVICQTETH